MRLRLGVYWGLRRIADDSGRFLLLDLGDAADDLLADLIDGLAPFVTGVVVGSMQTAAWRRFGSPHVGRIARVVTAADVAQAKRNAADAVLGPVAIGEAALRDEIARLGDDAAAELALAPRGSGPWVERRDSAGDTLAAGAAGYLATPAFWRPVRNLERAERRLRLADDLVPDLQRLTAAALDAAAPTWLDHDQEEERRS